MRLASRLLRIVAVLFLVNVATSNQSEQVKSSSSAEFAFPKYAYKRNSVAENRYKSMSNKCEFKTDCSHQWGYHKENCILKCISKQCYDEIYAFNPLEDGEIDQRIQSFKGCYAHFIDA